MEAYQSGKCFIVFGNGKNAIGQSALNLSHLPMINGERNSEVNSGFVYSDPEGKAKFSKSEIGPNGYLAAHRADGTACIVVIDGSGITGMVDDTGAVTDEVFLQAGDVIVFEQKMPLHFYRAGEQGLKYIAVNLS